MRDKDCSRRKTSRYSSTRLGEDRQLPEKYDPGLPTFVRRHVAGSFRRVSSYQRAVRGTAPVEA
jgi:hypothetical protein